MRNAPAGSVDVIIVDSTDPIGPGTGLFGPDFLADCHRVLRDDGIMVGQSESPFYHMPLMLDYHRAMAAAGFVERRSLLFPQPVYPGGSITGTLARKTGRLDEIRPLADGIVTRFYNTSLHRGLLETPAFIREALDGI